MSDVLVWNNTEKCIYQTPMHVQLKDIRELINGWRSSVYDYAVKQNKQHCVYCTEHYEDYKLKEVNLYAECLDDEDFFKRTDAVYNDSKDVYIGALHKGSSY